MACTTGRGSWIGSAAHRGPRFEKGDREKALDGSRGVHRPTQPSTAGSRPVLLIQGDDDRKRALFSRPSTSHGGLAERDLPFEELVLPNEIHGFSAARILGASGMRPRAKFSWLAVSVFRSSSGDFAAAAVFALLGAVFKRVLRGSRERVGARRMSRHGRAGARLQTRRPLSGVRRFARAEGLQCDNAGKQQRKVLFGQNLRRAAHLAPPLCAAPRPPCSRQPEVFPLSRRRADSAISAHDDRDQYNIKTHRPPPFDKSFGTHSRS